MAQRRKTVRELAQEANLEMDEVLVTLWDAGFEDVLGPQDQIVSGDLNRARRALGLATRRELKSPEFWMELFGADVAEFHALLNGLGITLSRHAKTLPQNSVTKLRKEARRRDLDPVTGTAVLAVKQEASPPPAQALEWRSPGHEQELRWLSVEEVLGIHHALVEDFSRTDDPLEPPGTRSDDLLASAVFRPQTSIGGELKYPTVETSAAALLHSLILNHPFHNGNKRSALVAMLVFLDENGLVPTCHEDELFKLVLLVAQHRIVDSRLRDLPDREVLAIADWLCKRVRLVEGGDHLIQWRKLRRILVAYGCELVVPGRGGNRINISRRIEVKRGFFGLRRTVELRTQVFYGDEGREAERNTVKKIREDLHLDDLHGIDSFVFYNQVPSLASDFIANYRKTLHRLAKL